MVGFMSKYETGCMASSGRVISKGAPGMMTGKKWIQAEQTHTGVVETPHKTNPVLPCCGWFWNQICRSRKAEHLKQILEETYKLTTDWGGICWAHTEQGLQQQRNPPFHAKVLMQFKNQQWWKKQHQPYPHAPLLESLPGLTPTQGDGQIIP